MDDIIEDFLRRMRVKKSKSTAQSRRSHIKMFTQWMDKKGIDDLGAVTTFDVENHLLELAEDGYAHKTISGRYHSLKLLYDFLQRKERIAENPVEGIDISEFGGTGNGQTKKEEVLKEDISYITPEEKEQLCENVPGPKVRNELIIRLLWQTGLRKQEAVDIELGDIDRDERSIRVRSAKTNSNRTVFYQPSLDFLMTQWIETNRNVFTTAESSPYLFVSRKAERLSENHMNRMVREAAKDAGIQEVMYKDARGNKRHKITTHVLRHSFAVQSLKNGMDIRTLQKLMGHKSLDITKKYLRLTDDDAKEMVRRFGPGSENVNS